MFNLNKIGKAVCSIQDNVQYKNKKIFICNDQLDDDVKQFNDMTLKIGKFQLTIDKEVDRSTMFVCGSAGSGKSYFVADYLKEYHRVLPKNPIYLVCEGLEDPVFDCLDYVHRVELDDVVTNPLNWLDFKDCMVVFDDVDGMVGKLKRVIYELRDKLLKNSRKYKVSVISTSHGATGLELKSVLNESQFIVFFMANYNRSLKYLLESYVGLDKKAIEKLRKMKSSRSTTYIKNYPSILLQDKYITTIDNF
jgi:hypothetical protein